MIVDVERRGKRGVVVSNMPDTILPSSGSSDIWMRNNISGSSCSSST